MSYPTFSDIDFNLKFSNIKWLWSGLPLIVQFHIFVQLHYESHSEYNNIAYIMLLILYCLIEYWFFNCILTQMKFHRLWSFCLPSGVIFYLVNCLSQLISIAIEESGRVFFEKIKYIFVLRVIDKVLLDNICHIKYLNIIFLDKEIWEMQSLETKVELSDYGSVAASMVDQESCKNILK